MLANALMTGIIGRIGQGFQQSATTYSIECSGSAGDRGVREANPGRHRNPGWGKALDRLSQYYITLCRKDVPDYRSRCGTVVDVVLTGGVTLGIAGGADEDTYWKSEARTPDHEKVLNPME